MKYFILLLVFLSSTACSAKLVLKSSDFVDTVKIEVQNGKIILPVSINNNTYRFFLDTGASGFIYQNGRVPLTVSQSGKYNTKDINGEVGELQKSTPTDIVIDKIKIADYEFAYMNGTGLDCFSDGIIGFDLIKAGVNVKIDLEKKWVILTDRKDFFRHEPGEKIDYKLVNSRPYISYAIGHGIALKAMFDTGSAGFLGLERKQYEKILNSNNRDWLAQQVVWSDTGRSTYSVNGLSPERETIFLKLDSVNFDNLSFSDVNAEVRTGFSVIGTGILKYGSVIIDPFRKELCYEPYQKYKIIKVSEPGESVVLAFTQNKAVVELLDKKSALYLAGLRKGDVILEVNKIKITDICTLNRIKDQLLKGTPSNLRCQDSSGNIKIIDIIL